MKKRLLTEFGMGTSACHHDQAEAARRAARQQDRADPTALAVFLPGQG
tara:strand:- start:651 stop:794 length:144 start_codon:yes stop_codon:yes gene_type:complete